MVFDSIMKAAVNQHNKFLERATQETDIRDDLSYWIATVAYEHGYHDGFGDGLRNGRQRNEV